VGKSGISIPIYLDKSSKGSALASSVMFESYKILLWLISVLYKSIASYPYRDKGFVNLKYNTVGSSLSLINFPSIITSQFSLVTNPLQGTHNLPPTAG